MKLFFTGCTHYNHELMVNHRGFSSTEEMNGLLFENLNSLVGVNDHLYHLGDFAMGGHKFIPEHRAKIRCKNVHLIYGNHCDIIRRTPAYSSLFTWAKDLYTVKFDAGDVKFRAVISHYPYEIWRNNHYHYFHLHSHCHGNLKDRTDIKRLDVGVDVDLYGHKRLTPWSMEDIIEVMNQKSFSPADHHTN